MWPFSVHLILVGFSSLPPPFASVSLLAFFVCFPPFDLCHHNVVVTWAHWSSIGSTQMSPFSFCLFSSLILLWMWFSFFISHPPSPPPVPREHTSSSKFWKRRGYLKQSAYNPSSLRHQEDPIASEAMPLTPALNRPHHVPNHWNDETSFPTPEPPHRSCKFQSEIRAAHDDREHGANPEVTEYEFYPPPPPRIEF